MLLGAYCLQCAALFFKQLKSVGVSCRSCSVSEVILCLWGLGLGLHWLGSGCSAVSVRPMSVVKLGMGGALAQAGCGVLEHLVVRLLLLVDM